MGYVGNTRGPRKSEIVAKLGNEYFGISKQQLYDEVQLYLEEESRREIDPVRIDETGRQYLTFYAPEGKLQRFYLDEHGYKLTGKVKAIIDNEEKEITL